MYTHRHHNPVQLLAILALIVTTACGEDSPTPTAPGSAVSAIAPRPDMLVGAALKPDGKLNAVRITSLTINPTALTIGGAGTPGTLATWTATIENPKKQGLSNVFIQARFVVYLPSGNISGWRGAGGAFDTMSRPQLRLRSVRNVHDIGHRDAVERCRRRRVSGAR